MGKFIALLTDFGIEDIYVAVMKAVMKAICPDAEFIDISHAISPQNIREGALALENAYAYFPEGTVFLVVVDPAVGSNRKPIIVKTENYYFVAPDNGVLSPSLEAIGYYEAAQLSNPKYQLANRSYTFHGRDIFAPAAAYAASGAVSLSDFGEIVPEIVKLPQALLRQEGNTIKGEVVHIDHFGNIITSIGRLCWQDKEKLSLVTNELNLEFLASSAQVNLANLRLEGIQSAYYRVPQAAFLAQIDSNGYLEIAINQGNAAKQLNVTLGDAVGFSWV